MSTYFNGANSTTYSSYYGPGGSVTIGADVSIGNITAAEGISMAGEGVVVNLGSVAGGDSAIDLADGGAVTNGSATDVLANIDGGDSYGGDGIIITGDGVVNNFGQIYGVGGAINIQGQAQIFNGGLGDYTASIKGAEYGIITGSQGTVTNYGSITAFNGGGFFFTLGVAIDNNGNELYIRNGNANDKAVIYGGLQGVYSPRSQIYNYGEIKGGSEGVHIGFSATIHNYGTIEGQSGIYTSSGDLSIYNSGTIYSSFTQYSRNEVRDASIVSGSGSTEFIKNNSSGVIKSEYNAIYTNIKGIATIINYGNIDAENVAIGFENSQDLLIVEAGSEITGIVLGGGGTLELGANGGPGTISRLGAGSEFDFSKYLVQSGANWTLAEQFTLGATGLLADYGTLTVTGGIDVTAGINVAGSVDITGTLVDVGAITAGAGGVVINDGLLEINQRGLLDIFGTLTGDGTIIVSDNNNISNSIDEGATIINYGHIDSENIAIQFDSSQDLLIEEGGSEITGVVLGGGGTLELGADGGPGTISRLGVGSEFGFSKYLVQSGADWTLAEQFTLGATGLLADYGALTLTGGIDITGTLVDVGAITAAAGGIVINDGLLEINQRGILEIAGTLTGDGTIVLGDNGTLEISGQATGGVVDFADATGTLTLADPLGLGIRIEGFQQGDIIDLPGVSDTSIASLSYGGGVLSVVENGALAAELSLTNVPAGTVFGLQGDHHGGMEVVVWSVPNVLPAAQLSTLENGIIALGRDVAATQGVTDPSLNVFTPQALLNPTGSRVKGDINIADGRPTAAGETITLGAKVQGIVLRGQHRGTEIIGHAANAYAATELLVGNNGNDTILGGGGSGTIIAGSGQNQIETGSGNMLVSSSGTDQIDTGTGDDTVYAGGVAWVTAQGNATVHGGAGFTTFTDSGTTSSADKVKGGSGTTVMNSGIGLDTFVGGSGTSFMNDNGSGRVALVFNKGVGGTDIVTGFDPSNGDYIRSTAASNGWAGFQNNISVIGGSSFVNLADGTKIEFVGFTNLSAADFHG